MWEKIPARWQEMLAILQQVWVLWLLASWGAVGACYAAGAAYDLFVSQVVPREGQEKWPKVPEIIGMIFGWLPWWAWGWIGTAIIAVASVEYATRLRLRIGSI